MRKKLTKLLTLLLTLALLSGLTVNAFAAETLSTERVTDPASPEALDPKVEAMLAWAVGIAADDTHGYSQANRFGPNYDCSSFVSTALMEGGFGIEDYLFPADMVEVLPDYGFVVYKKGETDPQRGDILVQPYVHVEICMGGLDCVGAHRNYDGRSGDRSGHEIEYRTEASDLECPFCHNAEYVYILRYEGTEIVYQIQLGITQTQEIE